MYDPRVVQPMREELTSQGFTELLTASAVDEALKSPETALVVVNSVCGCAAGGLRPGVVMSLQSGEKKPSKLLTVFAGQDREATERARSYFVGYPPSSPSVALLKEGKVVFMLERRDIEGHAPQQVATALKQAYSEHC